MDMVKLVLLDDLNCAYNYLDEFPPVLLQPNTAFAGVMRCCYVDFFSFYFSQHHAAFEDVK